MLSISSMQALDSKVVKDETMKHLDVRRFRANIISRPLPIVVSCPRANTPEVTGSDAYEEDEWKSIRLENAASKEECRFAVACRTVRYV